MNLTEEERLALAYQAICEALQMFGVCYAWDGFEDAEMWLEIDDEPQDSKPILRVVN